MSARVPCLLQSGDLISVVAPSGAFDEGELEQGLTVLRQWGLVPQLPSSLKQRHGYFAGDDAHRLDIIQAAIDDPKSRAIWCVRGGYGASRLLTGLNFDYLANNPKWLVGFSDITSLHSALWQRGIATLHGANLTTLNAWSEDARQQLWRQLSLGVETELKGQHALYATSAVTNTGAINSCEGPLFAANLSVLLSLLGTPFFPDLSGAILLIEEIGEAPYRLDRMLTQLLLSGALNGVVGVVIGQLTHCGKAPPLPAQPSAWDARNVVVERLSHLRVPLLTDVNVGHAENSCSVVNGVKATLNCVSQTLVCHSFAA